MLDDNSDSSSAGDADPDGGIFFNDSAIKNAK